MSLTPGTRLGIYEVTAKIGEGGMGEVYQARDTTLDRSNEVGAAQSLWQRPGAWLVVSLIVVVGLTGLLVLQSPPTSGSRVVRFVESTEGRMTFPREGRAVAISHDGNLLVYAAKNELYLRAFGSAVATQIPGSNDGTAPFFSPDGEWIGFFTTRQLKRVAVSGGLPFVVCDVPRGLSGTWGVDDTIVFSRHGLTGLFRVQASGGSSEQLTTRIDSDGDHDFADFLPDGKTVLFSISGPNFNFDDGQIVAQSLETGERTVVVDGGFNPRWVETGHLVYARGGGLFAVEFDPAQLQLQGEPVQFVSGVMQTGAGAQYAVSNDGTVVYVAGDSTSTAPEAELVWVDRESREEVLPVSPNSFGAPRVSPDGNRIIVAISEFPKWRKYLISLSFQGQSSVRPVQVGGFDVNIVIHRSTAVRGRGGPARHDAWPPSLGAILAHTDGPCGS